VSELKQFKLPDVGEGLTEADIVKWHVQPGDKVTINQIIVEIETAKAVVELPCPFDGVISELLVAEGMTVDVGVPIVSVQVGDGAPVAAVAAPTGAGEAPAGAAAAPAADAARQAEDLAVTDAVPDIAEQASGGGEAGAEGGKRQAVLVGYGVKLGRTTRRARKSSGPPAGPGPGAVEAAAAPAPAAPAPAPAPSAGTANGTARAVRGAGEVGGAGARALAKPPVRKLAKDLGVDLDGLTGSGPQGSITREDVQQAATGPVLDAGVTGARVTGSDLAGTGLADGAAGPREERVPIRGVRKHTAAAVSGSAFTAPHVTEFLQLDVTGTMEALARIRELPEFADLRVSPLLLAARALIVAISRHPMINSTWDEQAQEIVIHRYVNLGIAAATGRGLMVPNVKDAHALSLPGLARALGELAQTARAGKASPADLRDGTITITNVGVFGVDSGTPILTPGEAAILALGQIRDLPWVHKGELAIRKVTTLALSFDHRIVDGDLGSAVLRDVGAMLEDPLRMLAWI
jgi:pyruvate/2-oxoglutarate dehydrogenase complex dihydrolipoamide acyltransferase (E2) component